MKTPRPATNRNGAESETPDVLPNSTAPTTGEAITPIVLPPPPQQRAKPQAWFLESLMPHRTKLETILVELVGKRDDRQLVLGIPSVAILGLSEFEAAATEAAGERIRLDFCGEPRSNATFFAHAVEALYASCMPCHDGWGADAPLFDTRAWMEQEAQG